MGAAKKPAHQWQEVSATNGGVYYFNRETNETSIEMPEELKLAYSLPAPAPVPASAAAAAKPLPLPVLLPQPPQIAVAATMAGGFFAKTNGAPTSVQSSPSSSLASGTSPNERGRRSNQPSPQEQQPQLLRTSIKHVFHRRPFGISLKPGISAFSPGATGGSNVAMVRIDNIKDASLPVQ